jgi:uncharacterized protein
VSQKATIPIDERLPAHIKAPCLVNCEFTVNNKESYYLLTLAIKVDLTLVCQRCLSEFIHPYSNQTELAVCDSEALAEKMLTQYESIVADNQEIDLEAIIADELILYAPAFHPTLSDCDAEISKFVTIEA